MDDTYPPIDFPFEEEYDRLNLSTGKAGLADGEPLVRVRLPYGGDGWLARRHADVRAVLSDRRFSRADTIGKDIPRLTPDTDDDDYPNLLSMDPPDHTRLRRVGAQAFSAGAIALLEPQVQQVVDDLLAKMIDDGPPADLMDRFAWPLTITTICQFLGVPVEDRSKFQDWAGDSLSLNPTVGMAGANSLRGYIAGLVDQRRIEPADDFLSQLVKAKDEEDRLSEEEAIGFGVALLGAGYETTAHQFGNALLTLLKNPDQLAALQADPGLTSSAVEELMRYTPLFETAVIPQPRLATEDVEMGGVTIRAGECVFTDMAAANRDPRVFQDPEKLDVTRGTNPHVGFGHGPHKCIGMPLARLELRLGMSTLLRRLPDVELAVAESELTWKRGSVAHGPIALPLSWSDVRE